MDDLLLVLVCSVLPLNLGAFTLATDYFRSNTQLTWSQANDYCNENNGSLIQLNSENDLTAFTSAVCPSCCFGFHWTALQLDSKFGCEHDGKWIYDGWAKCPSWEPDNCPQHAYVVANGREMRTWSCCNRHTVLCRKDVKTSTERTNSSTAPADICTTTTSIPSTAAVTSVARTTTQSKLSAVLTTGVPKMSTDVAPTAYKDTLTYSSCEQCCFKLNKSRQLSHGELRSIIRDLKYHCTHNKVDC